MIAKERLKFIELELEAALERIEINQIDLAQEKVVSALVELKTLYALEFPQKYSRETW